MCDPWAEFYQSDGLWYWRLMADKDRIIAAGVEGRDSRQAARDEFSTTSRAMIMAVFWQA